MNISAKNAWKLAILGMVQVAPFTLFAVYGAFIIWPLLIWGLGITLFVFYIKHGRNQMINIQKIKRFWLGSIIFNSLGAIMLLLWGIVTIIELVQSGNFRLDDVPATLGWVLLLLPTIYNARLSRQSYMALGNQTPNLTPIES
ncbi:MAG: hypothetical protein AAF490_31410 [Chloroflexota bacterium]